MKQRFYSLFVKRDGKYIRLSPFAEKKPAAVRFFQNALLAGSFNGHAMYLRPVEGNDFANHEEYKRRREEVL